MVMVEIIPAILVKDRAELVRHILLVNGLVSKIQIDIMDGKFVPNKTVSLSADIALPKIYPAKYEIHWMVDDPLSAVRAMSGPFTHLVHVERIDSEETFRKIKTAATLGGGELALAINPETPIEKLLSFVRSGNVREVLIMTVRPGFSGQKFIGLHLKEKIDLLRNVYPGLVIEVDGGINLETIGIAATAGANLFVAASAIFSSSDIKNAIDSLKEKAEQGKQGK